MDVRRHGRLIGRAAPTPDSVFWIAQVLRPDGTYAGVRMCRRLLDAEHEIVRVVKAEERS